MVLGEAQGEAPVEAPDEVQGRPLNPLQALRQSLCSSMAFGIWDHHSDQYQVNMILCTRPNNCSSCSTSPQELRSTSMPSNFPTRLSGRVQLGDQYQVPYMSMESDTWEDLKDQYPLRKVAYMRPTTDFSGNRRRPWLRSTLPCCNLCCHLSDNLSNLYHHHLKDWALE